MSRPHAPLRVILLAPVRSVGGITTWARFLTRYFNPRSVSYRVIDTSKSFLPPGRISPVINAVLGLRDAAVRIGELLACVRTFRPDLVYITSSPSVGVLVRDCPCILLLKLMGIPVVEHIHGETLQTLCGGIGLGKAVLTAALKRTLAVLVITRQAERHGKELLGDDKVIYVPNMIDDTMLSAPREAPAPPPQGAGPVKMLHVGEQSRPKGTMDVIEAIPLTHHPVACDFVGDSAPENRAEFERRVRQLGLTGVRFTGIKRGKDLHDAFRSADMYVFPSHTEGFPMTLLEAMAFGLPIIATDVGNIGEMIGAGTDSPAGVLLEKTNPVDPGEIAGAIDRLAGDADLRRRLGENGRQRVKRYAASVVVLGLENLLRCLCDPGPRAAGQAPKWPDALGQDLRPAEAAGDEQP